MKFRRRKYLINTGFQIKIILTYVLISFIGSMIAVSIFSFYAFKKLESLMWSTHISVQSTGELIKPLFLRTNIAGFIFIATLLAVTAYLIFKRTSGPIYKMSLDINKAAHGDLTGKISLRQKDEFKDVAHDLDEMLTSLRDRFSTLSGMHNDISTRLEGLGKETSATDCNAILADIAGMEIELRRSHDAGK